MSGQSYFVFATGFFSLMLLMALRNLWDAFKRPQLKRKESGSERWWLLAGVVIMMGVVLFTVASDTNAKSAVLKGLQVSSMSRETFILCLLWMLKWLMP